MFQRISKTPKIVFILGALVALTASFWIYHSVFNSNELLNDLRDRAAEPRTTSSVGADFVISQHIPIGMNATEAESLMNSYGFFASEYAWANRSRLANEWSSERYIGFVLRENDVWPITTQEYRIVFGVSDELINATSAVIFWHTFGI